MTNGIVSGRAAPAGEGRSPLRRAAAWRTCRLHLVGGCCIVVKCNLQPPERVRGLYYAQVSADRIVVPDRQQQRPQAIETERIRNTVRDSRKQ